MRVSNFFEIQRRGKNVRRALRRVSIVSILSASLARTHVLVTQLQVDLQTARSPHTIVKIRSDTKLPAWFRGTVL